MSDELTLEGAYRAVAVSTTREALALKEELAALRARHEKLREGIVDLMGKWHFSGNQSCAEELNALLEDE